MAWAKVTTKVPDVDQAFKSGNYDFAATAVKNGNIAMMKRINASHGTSISKYGKALAIPDGVIISFISSESGGTPVQTSNPQGAAKYDVWGIMATSPASIFDAVTKWKNHVKTEEIPAEVREKINQKVPGLLKAGASAALLAQIRTALKTDNDFTIMGGCLVLRWLFERFSVMGVTIFNKALVSYNAGLYQSFLIADKKTLVPNLIVTDTATLIKDAKVPQESKSYLLKVLGTDGFMDLYYRQNLIVAAKENISMPATDNPVTTSATVMGGVLASIKSALQL